MNAKYPWIFVVLFLLFALFLLNPHPSYAQEDEGDVATQTFTLHNPSLQSARTGTVASTDLCTVTAELRWYKTKKVKVMYHWQHCSDSPMLSWKLASIKNANGAFALTSNTGLTTVYYKTWPELKTGDRIALHTWINDAPQLDVVTEYKDSSPIWVKLHTRQDNGGACFQFTGHVDPWGVFTAGDQAYVFELSAQDWETPWVIGPNQPTVDWHVQFYRDAALTQLRTEYWFNNVANPCYSKPTVCEGITLSLPDGSAIPDTGAAVDVTVRGQSDQYRIVDQTGQLIAGPSAEPHFNIQALPDVVYQAQLYSAQYGWTNSGCQFHYGKLPRPVCNGVALAPSTDTLLPPTGQAVQVTVSADNATQYRIVDVTTGQPVAGPTTEALLTFQARPAMTYQAQVYNETYGWTTSGCQFQYGLAERPSCTGLTLDPKAETTIPLGGQAVDVIVHGIHATHYRIVDTTSGVVVAGPTADNHLVLEALPAIVYQAELYNEVYGWVKDGCTFSYGTVSVISCQGVDLSIPNGAYIAETGAEVQLTINAENATQFRVMNLDANKVEAGPGANAHFTLHLLPGIRYQGQVLEELDFWSNVNCEFSYRAALPVVCDGITLSIPDGAMIPSSGADVLVTVEGSNATQYQLVDVDNKGAPVAGPGPDPTLRFHAMPGIVYQAQVADAGGVWTTSGCQFSYIAEEVAPPVCLGVALSVPDGAVIAASGAEVAVTVSAQNATSYQLVDEYGQTMVGPGSDAQMAFHAMPAMRYQAQVANAKHGWTKTGCTFTYKAQPEQAAAFCELRASHYGDPGGRSRITAWVKDQITPVAIEKVRINWNGKGEVTYPTKRQAGPWFTNSEFTLLSRPEVFDVGFGYYQYEAWVYIAGIAEPAYCWGDGNAPDHDNVLPDPGPFTKPNPEGKLDRGSIPSRLPTVGRLPFDGGNGQDKVELILWAFEKEGRGVNARITAVANEGKPLARLGMSSVSNVAKFDGLNAREGIVYGFQIGEHGPWGPLFCPLADNDPTTITVYWAAGGLTWLSDSKAYGDCWWLTVAAALNGWVTVDERVATYNALQPIINWNGHRNLVFSLAQSRETGLGPRMQDMVIGLQAREWQGPVLPATLPADFTQTVESYQAAQAK